jgi:Raf kinase inhibitor-like YbhB/YbcL family protein
MIGRVAAGLLALAAAWPAAAMTLTSPEVKDGAPMAAEQVYTQCGGRNASPTLKWAGAPAATKSFAVTMIDLSVKPNDWSHWIIVRIMPSIHGLPHGGPSVMPPGARGVVSNMGDGGYNGPCPPPGTGVHRYEITVWAMPTASVNIAPNAHANDVRAMLAKSAIDHASIVATAGK